MRNSSIFRRLVGPVSTNPRYRLWKNPAIVTSGTDQNRNTSGSFTRVTGDLYFTCTFMLEQILWDIRNNGNYTIDFVDGTGASPGVLYNIMPSTALTGGAENTINLTPPIIILPGRHYLSISASSTTWSDKNAAYQFYVPYYTTGRLYYGGTGYDYNHPIKIVGRVIDINGISNYTPVSI